MINKHQASELTNLSANTLAKFRRTGELIKGVHWEVINSRVVRYRKDLLLHWSEHRHEPQVHLAKIESFLQKTN